MLTRWAADVSPDNVWPQYPRPQLARERWQSLNGLWDYAVLEAGAARFDGQILVPFPIESALSGVMKPFLPDQTLRYERTFEVPASWRSERVWLHFDAVDWEAQVWVNETKIGEHRGGYDRFGFDVTGALIAGENSLRVEVKDATNSGEQVQIYGKQTLHPAGCSYTASSGIWQSVWLEPVPAAHIARLEITPDVAASSVKIRVESVLAGEVSLEVRALRVAPTKN